MNANSLNKTASGTEVTPKTKTVKYFNGDREVDIEAEVHGDFVLFKGRYAWVVRNEKTGLRTNRVFRADAMAIINGGAQ